MKKIYFIFITVATVYLLSCVNSPIDKAESTVKSYPLENLKNSDINEATSFGKLDTVKNSDGELSLEDGIVDLPSRIIWAGEYNYHEFSYLSNSMENLKWFGLFQDSSGYYLSQTKIKIQKATVFVCEYEEEGWEVKTDNEDETILLIEGLDYLTNIKVQNVNFGRHKFPYTSRIEIYSGDTISFKFLDVDYRLSLDSHKKTIKGHEYEYRKLFLISIKEGQIQKTLLSTSLFQWYEVKFAGDIDGDNFLDLLITKSSEYETLTSLYLSKSSVSNQLLKIVGQYVTQNIECGGESEDESEDESKGND